MAKVSQPFTKWTIVEIDWVDSQHTSGWRQSDSLEPDYEEMRMKSIGYVLWDNKDSIAVVQSRDAKLEKDTQIDALMEIPKVAITKIRPLK